MAIRYMNDRADVLVALAPHLNDEQKIQALSAAREIEDECARARVLAVLASYLNNELKTYALQDALSATREIKEEENSFARMFKGKINRADILIAIAPHLNNELKIQALSIAREIKDKYWRARALGALAPYLNNELKTQVLQEALSAVRETKWENLVHLLVILAPHLNDELKTQAFQEAVSAALKINDEKNRAKALDALMPYINDEVRITVLQELLLLSGYEALNMWEKIEYKGLKENIILLIKFTSQKGRIDGVSVVKNLAPALVHFSGEGIASELYRAVQDTARWWP